jgi:glycosyl hydrolase family 2
MPQCKPRKLGAANEALWVDLVRRSLCSLCLLLFVSSAGQTSAAEPGVVSLAGQWRYELDRANVGIAQRWYARRLTGELKLPGSLPGQGIGDEVSTATKWTGDIVDKSWFTDSQYAKYRQPGNIKVPFWLQPDKYFAGVAWYQREIEIPLAWRAKRVMLRLERPHWETRVWLDDKLLGSNDSLSTPHEYALGTGLAPGRHRLTIRVDNGLVVDIGVNSHSISDHTQGNWNGIVGQLELRSTPPVWLKELRVFPADASGQFHFVAKIGNATDTDGQGTLSVVRQADPGLRAKRLVALTELPMRWAVTGAVVEANCVLPEADRHKWDEFTPKLCRLQVKLSTGDSKEVEYGSRRISTDGTQFLINGGKTFIRGTLECCIFPKTGVVSTISAQRADRA